MCFQDEMGPPMPREAWPPGMPPQHYRGGPRPPHPGSMEGVSLLPVPWLGKSVFHWLMGRIRVSVGLAVFSKLLRLVAFLRCYNCV